ncbi:tetratricopeptide repeat protein [Methanobrevibacter boviskoreani]|uniref:tetratricopeptide repeat protein n=1 Tax=Methanobrevibacter boviskoreani TaxID=1348249 RepID=UPI0023A828AE|nr:hypothetical protein [Methanobrevibacter boviskoreani]MCI6774240.1 tetratricopeptide repeat protein [Methanobrevibacter boviskoreani]MCI6931215.1 tetratricopeptide repeat protein [Methanobrevibacter boviskoreani]MDY5615168.1 hypothetical protein [Methanobrevibacter boviskoreani]
MDRYQGWKWYDTGLIILLLIAALYCIIIMSDYFMGVACLAVILMVIGSFTKEIYVFIASVYKKRGNYNKSLKLCDKVLDKDSKYVYAVIEKGSIYEEMNQTDKALKTYDCASSMDKELYIPLRKKGDLYTKLNRSDEAQKAYEKANILKLRKDEERWTFRLLEKISFGKR